MNANYTPSSRVYSNSDIASANKAVKYYHQQMEAMAITEFDSAVKRETADSVAEQFTEETLFLLENISLDAKTLGSAADELRHLLSNELSNHEISDLKSNQEWIKSRGSDLALAITTFWLSLDKDPSGRRDKCRKLIHKIKDNYSTSDTEKCKLIFSRFFIDQPGMIRLLTHINSLSEEPITTPTGVAKREQATHQKGTSFNNGNEQKAPVGYH